MGPIRSAFIRFWVWVFKGLSSEDANPADVYFAYRLLLNREPEPSAWNNNLIGIQSDPDRWALVERFLNSAEFLSRQESLGALTIEPFDTGRFIMWLDPEDDLVAQGIMASNSYEPYVTAALERILAPESTFVDIGANMGWFTLLAASRVRRVIAIEPNHNNVQLLYRSLLSNGFENVKVIEGAVTDGPRFLQLNFYHSNGAVAPIEEMLGSTSFVHGDSLDNLLRDVDSIDVMKMDIEGHEPIALRGMAGILARFRPILLVEFHPAAIRANSSVEPEVLLDGLRAHGYRLAVIRHDGSETSSLDNAGIVAEWEKLDRKLKSGGTTHLDIICRPD